jgi:hypothetical protein
MTAIRRREGNTVEVMVLLAAVVVLVPMIPLHN